MKYEKYEEMLDIIDKLPRSYYIPTIDELKTNNVEQNFEKYADFLLYISENLTEIIHSPETTEFNRIQAKETNKYISKLFKDNLKY